MTVPTLPFPTDTESNPEHSASASVLAPWWAGDQAVSGQQQRLLKLLKLVGAGLTRPEWNTLDFPHFTCLDTNYKEERQLKGVF